MDVRILKLKEGAKKAKGAVIVIDVFRAFSVEAYLLNNNCKYIIPVATVEEAFSLKKEIPNSVLIGERNGIKIEGFDYGNSPSEIVDKDFTDKVVIHTTSAGTQGIALAKNAEIIMGGNLLNAKYTAKYLKEHNYQSISLVAMGLNGIEETDEDNLCAEYIKSILLDDEMDIKERMENLKYTSGKKFFTNTKVFPTQDFYLCLKPNIFDFVIKLVSINNQNVIIKEK